MAAPASEVRVRVAAVIPTDHAIVLVRHEKEGAAYHLLPGGGVEPGESLTTALVREVLEETGLVVEPDHLLFVNDSIAPDSSRHVVQITFLARRVGGECSGTSVDPRVAAVESVGFDRLEGLDLRPPMASELLRGGLNGFSNRAVYLGSLWEDAEARPSRTDRTEVDGPACNMT